MSKHINTSGGMLILPDGTEVPNGEGVEIDAETAKNVGVADWIKGGALTKDGGKSEPKPDDKAKA